jgi:hypothetical protein
VLPRPPEPRRRRRPGTVAAIAAAALLAGGCATSVAGEASPPPVESTGPLGQVLDEADLVTASERTGNVIVDTAGDGDGGVHALVHEPGEERPSTLVSVPADGDGFGEPSAIDVPQVVSVDTVHATREGRVLVVGQVDPEDSDSTMFGLLVIDPETGRGPAYDLLPADGEYRDSTDTALSPDQNTLVALVQVDLGDTYDLRLLAVDVDSGEIRASRNLDDLLTEDSIGAGVAVAEDGTVVVAADIYDDPTDSDSSYPAVARFDADLEPRGDLVPLGEPGQEQEFEALGVTAEGTVVAHLRDGYESLVLTLAPGSGEPAVAVDSEDYLNALVVEPAGRWVHMLGDDGPVSANLETGEITDPVSLCGPEVDEVSFLLPAGDGSVLAQGYCSTEDSDEEPPEQVWKVGPAA